MKNSLFTLRWIILLSWIPNTVPQEYFYDGTEEGDNSEDNSHQAYDPRRQGDDPEGDVEVEIPIERVDSTSSNTADGPDCGRFDEYIGSCTAEAKRTYNSTINSPPLSTEIKDWCKSVRLLLECATAWNDRCGASSSHRVIAESVRGQNSVVQGICDNEAYLERYKWNSYCIPQINVGWGHCYTKFKRQVDAIKSGPLEWIHYENHFYLCCIRAQFRRCTLHVLTSSCAEQETIVLQKFSIIVSEGEVYQNCEIGVVYEKCPGGDPRPPDSMKLAKMPLEVNSFQGVQVNRAPAQASSTAPSLWAVVSLFAIRWVVVN